MEKYENIDPVDHSPWILKTFTVFVVVSQIFGIGSVVLVAIWMGHYREGFAWQSDPSKQFNYHPLFMIIGMVFLYGDALLVYRVFRNEKKIFVKVLHAVLQVLSLIFAGVGLKAVFDSHNLPKPPTNNMYSLHSWLGIVTVALFGAQWCVGFFTFLLPGLASRLRALYKPVHVFWGVVIYVLAVSTALMGISEKNLFSNDMYKNRNEEGIISNTLGLVLVVFGILVVYLVTNTNFQRQPLPEEEQLSMLDD